GSGSGRPRRRGWAVGARTQLPPVAIVASHVGVALAGQHGGHLTAPTAQVQLDRLVGPLACLGPVGLPPHYTLVLPEQQADHVTAGQLSVRYRLAGQRRAQLVEPPAVERLVVGVPAQPSFLPGSLSRGLWGRAVGDLFAVHYGALGSLLG